jgi:aspartyl-tRNA(Asn)/glutamyl-tRNA(Gln) amidotransferase subunit A
LPVAQGLTITENFYWDFNERTRAFYARVKPRLGAGEPMPKEGWLRLDGVVELTGEPPTRLALELGLPVVAVPVPQPDGMPIAVQIITAPWREDVALRIAHQLEARGIARAPRPPV